MKAALVVILSIVVLSTMLPAAAGVSYRSAHFCRDLDDLFASYGACVSSWANEDLAELLSEQICQFDDVLGFRDRTWCTSYMISAMTP